MQNLAAVLFVVSIFGLPILAVQLLAIQKLRAWIKRRWLVMACLILSGGFLGEQVIAAGVTGYGITGGLNGEQTAVSVSALAANSCTTGTELCNINTASNLGTTNCGGYQWAYVRALVVTASTPSANGSINLEWLMGGTTSGVPLETFPGGTGTPARTDAVLPLLTSTTSQYVNSGPNPIVLPMGVYFQPVVQNLAGSAATISIYVDPVTPNAN